MSEKKPGDDNGDGDRRRRQRIGAGWIAIGAGVGAAIGVAVGAIGTALMAATIGKDSRK
jgi:hypothetical protein